MERPTAFFAESMREAMINVVSVAGKMFVVESRLSLVVGGYAVLVIQVVQLTVNYCCVSVASEVWKD